MHHSTYISNPLAAFRAKDPWSALTHFFGLIFSVFATPLILIHASLCRASCTAQISLSIFMLSMFLLYGASTAYHTFLLPLKSERILKRLDHCMIYVLIAGSYTPVCLCLAERSIGLPILLLVWGTMIIGNIFSICWITCPKWVSSLLYIIMGWSCVWIIPYLWRTLPAAGFLLLLFGGLFYTGGGVIYALKLKKLNQISPDFGSHEIFHVCVLIGSLLHYVMMYMYVR